MRTTLNIADDVLAAAKSLAVQQRRPVGEVISELARRALVRPAVSAERNGVPLLPVKPRSTPVTLDLVNQLRDEDLDE